MDRIYEIRRMRLVVESLYESELITKEDASAVAQILNKAQKAATKCD